MPEEDVVHEWPPREGVFYQITDKGMTHHEWRDHDMRNLIDVCRDSCGPIFVLMMNQGGEPQTNYQMICISYSTVWLRIYETEWSMFKVWQPVEAPPAQPVAPSPSPRLLEIPYDSLRWDTSNYEPDDRDADAYAEWYVPDGKMWVVLGATWADGAEEERVTQLLDSVEVREYFPGECVETKCTNVPRHPEPKGLLYVREEDIVPKATKPIVALIKNEEPRRPRVCRRA